MQAYKHLYQYLSEIRELANAAPAGKARQIINRADRAAALLRRSERMDGGIFAQMDPVQYGTPAGADVRAAYDKRATDRQRILEILQAGRSLTTAEAIELGILRAGARVYELRRKGYIINTEMIKSGADRIAKYTLIN